MTSPLAWILKLLVRGYQLLISPLIGPNCRYTPSCSAYALDAVKIHGGLKGGWLAIRRIGRCHPWGGFGYDPVPDSDHACTAHDRTGTGQKQTKKD